MFTPLPLRLCCMAAMAPALTEAASQARVKLSSNAQGTPNPTLVNGRDCPRPQPAVSDRALTRSPVQSVVGRPQFAALVTPKELLPTKRLDGSGKPNPSLTHLGTVTNLSQIYKHDKFTAVRATPNGGLLITDSKSCMSHPSKPNISCKFTMMNGGSNGQSAVTGKFGMMGHTTNTQGKLITNALHSLSAVDRTKTYHIQESRQTTSNSTQHQQKVKNLTAMGSMKTAITSVGSLVNSGPKTTVGNIVRVEKDKISQDDTEASVKSHIDSVADVAKRQRELERQAWRLLRRVRRLQTRQANVHVQKQLNGFVDYQHKNLQSMAKSMKAPVSSTDLKTELLQKEDVKSLSTAALVNLVRKLQSSQTITLRQRLASNNMSGSGDDNSVLTLDKDLCSELSRVSGQLRTNLHHLETAFDSDATESSSGGESCDEEEEYDFDIDGRYQSMPLHRRAEWKWAVDRAAVAARWTWLQAQVSDLEYRIRQQSEIYRQIRQAKSGVVLGEQSAPQDLVLKLRPSRTSKKLSPIEAKIANLEKRNELSPCSLSTLLSNVDKQAATAAQSGSGSSGPPSMNGPPVATNKGRLQAPPKPPNGYIDPNISRGNHTATSADSDIEILDPLNKKAKTSSTPSNGGSSEGVHSPVIDPGSMAARCRPLRSYRKRKLLRTWGLHQVSRKAARLSTVKCHCFPPSTPCAMCGGRFNNTQTVDAEVTPLPERVSLIDTSFHPVLSFPQDIPLPVHFEALLKSGDWQNKPPPKPVRPLQSEKRRMKLSSAAVSEHIRKHTKKLPKSVAASLLSSARIRNKYDGKQLSRSTSLPTTPKNVSAVTTTRLLKSDIKLHKRKAALHALAAMKRQRSMSLPSPAHKHTCLASPTERDTPSPLAGSCPSSTFKEMREAMKKRRGESAFDINNIVIPYSMAASTRVEKLQYKEIITPKWRLLSDKEERGEVKEETKKEAEQKPDGNQGFDRKIKEEVGKEEPEDISDDSFAVRHLRCEINEKKRFISYITQQKRGRSMRTDSECCTPDPLSPESSLGADTMFTTLQSLPPTPATPTTLLPTSASRLTTLSEEHEETLKHVSSTPQLKDDVQIRRRSGSMSKVQRTRTMSTEDGGRSQAGTPAPPDVVEDHCILAPWEQRTFPLCDADYDILFQETPVPEPSTSNITGVTMINAPGSLKSGFSEADSPNASNPCSPLASSSASSIVEDDPNDPEWTVVSPEKQPAIPKTGIVLKLAKR